MDVKNLSQFDPESLCKLLKEDEVYLIVNSGNEKKTFKNKLLAEKEIKDQGSFDMKTEKHELRNDRLREKKNVMATSLVKKSKSSPNKKNVHRNVKKFIDKSNMTIQKMKIISVPKRTKTLLALGPFTCNDKLISTGEICNETFTSCCDYTLHFRADHQKNRRCVKCRVCEKLLRPCDTEEHSDFECNICGFGFDSQEDLDYHLQRHIKQRPHKCELCPKSFSENATLIKHMRVHTGEKPFECSYCPSRFTQKSHLNVHIFTHTNEKPHSCVLCGKCFTQVGALRSHMRTHTNICPFKCGFCRKDFREKYNLIAHVRKRHR